MYRQTFSLLLPPKNVFLVNYLQIYSTARTVVNMFQKPMQCDAELNGVDASFENQGISILLIFSVVAAAVLPSSNEICAVSHMPDCTEVQNYPKLTSAAPPHVLNDQSLLLFFINN